MYRTCIFLSNTMKVPCVCSMRCIIFLLIYFSVIVVLMLQKITVAECIETQSKAMTMLTIDQLSYLLKFALQKIKQPGVRSRCLHFCVFLFKHKSSGNIFH